MNASVIDCGDRRHTVIGYASPPHVHSSVEPMVAR